MYSTKYLCYILLCTWCTSVFSQENKSNDFLDGLIFITAWANKIDKSIDYTIEVERKKRTIRELNYLISELDDLVLKKQKLMYGLIDECKENKPNIKIYDINNIVTSINRDLYKLEKRVIELRKYILRNDFNVDYSELIKIDSTFNSFGGSWDHSSDPITIETVISKMRIYRGGKIGRIMSTIDDLLNGVCDEKTVKNKLSKTILLSKQARDALIILSRKIEMQL